MSEGERPGPPTQFWSVMIALAGVVLAGLSLLFSASKSDRDETRRLEQRLCRLEALNNMGECKR